MPANDTQVGGDFYKTKYEHWDLAIKIPLGYLEGCATKYVARWRKKGGIQDLQKAEHYLQKLIETTEEKWLTPNIHISRNLIPEDIETEVAKFAVANGLELMEQMFILTLCSYRKYTDLAYAQTLLTGLINEAHIQTNIFPDEPNYPGTPDNGGHHT